MEKRLNKLTRIQRHTLYVVLLLELKKVLNKQGYFPHGVCCLYKEVFDSYDLYDMAVLWLPELYQMRTRSGWWFCSTEERMAALKKCIELTA